MQLFLLLVLLICYSNCLESHESEDYWIRRFNSERYQGHQHFDNVIERPCSPHDTNCIREFFAHTFRCSPVHGPAPHPYKVKDVVLELPHSNITLTLDEAEVTGLNSGKIKEFYVNKKSGTLVLEVEFDRVVVYTPHTIATYHLKGREPVESSDFTIIEFKHFSLTLTIRNYQNARHSKSNVYAYFEDAKPRFKFGPGFVQKEIVFMKMNQKWWDDMALSAKEAFLVQGPMYMAAFLNHLICDSRRH